MAEPGPTPMLSALAVLTLSYQLYPLLLRPAESAGLQESQMDLAAVAGLAALGLKPAESAVMAAKGMTILESQPGLLLIAHLMAAVAAVAAVPVETDPEQGETASLDLLESSELFIFYAALLKVGHNV